MIRKRLRPVLMALGLSLMMSVSVLADEVEADQAAPLPVSEMTAEGAENSVDERLPEDEQQSTDDEALESEASEPSEDVTEIPEETEPEEEDNNSAQEQSGWQEDVETGAISYISENGEKAVGFKTIGKNTYCFDEKGSLRLGFYRAADKKTYYFEPEGTLGETKGAMARGWREIDGNNFYFKWTGAEGIKGKMLTGWQKIGDKTYYFQHRGELGTSGKMYAGWAYINHQVFYFKATGAPGVKGQMFTGWQYIGKKLFYFNPTGGFGTKGARKIGWFDQNGKRFYLKTSGGTGITGSLQIGWQTIGKNTYYFKQSGARGTVGQMFKGGLKTVGSDKYYFNSKGVRETGWKKLGNYWYYMDDKKAGAMAVGKTDVPVGKGYHQYNSYQFYFRESKSGSAPKGSLIQDVSGIIGRQKNYRAEIDRVRCVVTIYAKDAAGQYRIPVKAMTCSVGLPATPTPKSTYKWPFHTIEKYRWATLMGPSYGQYSTRIVAGILFHSVAGSNTTSYNLAAGNYNMLGMPASHGCVRLCVRDAKWIYDNCSLGMEVIIQDNVYQPFDKPATIKIPGGQTWDPTDPNV